MRRVVGEGHFVGEGRFAVLRESRSFSRAETSRWDDPQKRIPVQSAEETTPPNLRVWKALSGEFLKWFHCKNDPKRLSGRQQSTGVQWSPLQWSVDESRMYHGVSNKIHIYCAGDDFGKPLSKIRSPNYSIFSISPSVARMVIFTPESKGKPARVALCSIAPVEELLSKLFYQTEECSIKWSPALWRIGQRLTAAPRGRQNWMGSQYGAFGLSNKSSFDESHASTLDCSYGSTVEDTQVLWQKCIQFILLKRPQWILLQYTQSDDWSTHTESYGSALNASYS